MAENYKLVVGIDKSNENDCSVISQICKNCNHIISVKVYEPHVRAVKAEEFKKCPICGCAFSEISTYEERVD